jgi:CubicO group peptidase (beta-lactamase class C family)
MKLRTTAVASALLLFIAQLRAAEELKAETASQKSEVRDLADVLQPILEKHKVPALAAAVVKNDRLVGQGAVGLRRSTGKEKVTVDDSFHIGSCTKAMTATLCARLVEQGKLKWDSTIGEVFADQAEKIAPEFHSVTLEQLLNHRSGLPEDRSPSTDIWSGVHELDGPMIRRRRKLVELVLAKKPATKPGEKHQYSNLGYTIAGAMCERVTGKAYEDLMRAELFEPLGMKTAGFGPPGSGKNVDQPQGHAFVLGAILPIPPGEMADNPPIIAPAGTVHCSLADWAKFAAMHVRGARDKDTLLSAESFRKLHTPTDGDYSFGWVSAKRGWAGGTALTHSGSNTIWFAVVWLAPKQDQAFLAACNLATDAGFKAADDAVGAMIQMVDSL